MFNFNDNKATGNIGDRNVQAVEEKLKELGIPILASHTGGKIGRTMIVDLDDFIVNIRTANKEVTIL